MIGIWVCESYKEIHFYGFFPVCVCLHPFHVISFRPRSLFCVVLLVLRVSFLFAVVLFLGVLSLAQVSGPRKPSALPIRRPPPAVFLPCPFFLLGVPPVARESPGAGNSSSATPRRPPPPPPFFLLCPFFSSSSGCFLWLRLLAQESILFWISALLLLRLLFPPMSCPLVHLRLPPVNGAFGPGKSSTVTAPNSPQTFFKEEKQ